MYNVLFFVSCLHNAHCLEKGKKHRQTVSLRGTMVASVTKQTKRKAYPPTWQITHKAQGRF
jgi:hypothetical protein